jgi:hypothetical protein
MPPTPNLNARMSGHAGINFYGRLNMRNLTLDEKITLKGKLAKKGLILPRLNTAAVVFYWYRCYGTSIIHYYKIRDTI